jgi:hypothetical protein
MRGRHRLSPCSPFMTVGNAKATLSGAAATVGKRSTLMIDRSVPFIEARHKCRQPSRRGARVMTARRERLPNRRASETFGYECNSSHCLATVSFFSDGRLAEIFISNAKAGSHSDSAAKDSAVVCSLALQHGVALETIRHALLRDARGVASSPLGAALDLVAERGGS